MDKPITIRRAECIDGICSVINASGLPAFVVMDILDRIRTDVQQLVEQEYQRDLATYKESEDNADNEPPCE